MKKSLMSIILAVVTAVGIPTTTAFAAEATPTRDIPVSVRATSMKANSDTSTKVVSPKQHTDGTNCLFHRVSFLK